MRPTLGKEPAAEDANPVGYLSGDTGIGLATFSYNLSITSCLQTPRRLTIICLICPAVARRSMPRRFRLAWSILALRLLGALICRQLQRSARHLMVSFHHARDAYGERAANDKECEIPSHCRSLPYLHAGSGPPINPSAR